jgi:hypothetical protein
MRSDFTRGFGDKGRIRLKWGIMKDEFGCREEVAGLEFKGLGGLQIVAASRFHSATFRDVPGSCVIPYSAQPRSGNQDAQGHDQKSNRHHDDVADCRRDPGSAGSGSSSDSKQVVCP